MADHDSHGASHSSSHSGGSHANRQAAVFVAVLAAALALALGSVFILKLHPVFAFLLLAAVAVVLVFMPKIEVFLEYERGVLFRLGKFQQLVGPGLAVIFPIIDRVVRVDMRDQLVDVPPQQVITRDNIKLTMDAIVYTKVVDAKKAVIEVKDYQKAISSVLQAEIRNITAKMDLENVLEKTEDVNAILTRRAKENADKWGVIATRVEVEHIILPPSLTETMTQRREAEERKARVIIEAEARTAYVDALNASASKLTPTTMQYLYLDSLKRIGESGSTKIVLPVEINSFLESIVSRFGAKKQ